MGLLSMAITVIIGNALKLILVLFSTLFLLYIIQRSIDLFLFHYITPSKPLQKYRRLGPEPTYALITGGNGGIGYGIALSLVRHGFGVILLGRHRARLAAAADQLRDALVLPTYEKSDPTVEVAPTERDEYVRFIVLDPQTAMPAEIEEAVRKEIVKKGLHVSILVNNVGTAPIAYPPYRGLITYSPDDIDNILDLNTRFMAHLTTCMLPVLARTQGRPSPKTGVDGPEHSLILNLSSGAKIGLPYQVMYASTKAFTSAFSIGLAQELEADPLTRHINVLSILAGDVRSQGNIAGLIKGSPESKAYGKYIVEKVDGAIKRGLREMTPYWPHHFNFILLSVTPDWLVEKGVRDIMLHKMDAMNEATKPKDK